MTADEYLSGNVRKKLREAQRMADLDPSFEPNVAALTSAQPKDLDASEIDVRLGATWVDKAYIQQFMYYGFDKMLSAIPMYAYFAVSMGICAAIWSVAALAVAVWMADKMLTMVIPVCIYRLWSSGILYYLLGVDLPHPSAMFNDGLTYESFKHSLAAYLVLFVLSFLCYFCGVSKRGINA